MPLANKVVTPAELLGNKKPPASWPVIECQNMTLGYPPPLNHLYATVRGRRVLSAAGRAYKRDVAINGSRNHIVRTGGLVRVTIHVYRPRKLGDLDGCFKVLLDALTGVAWHDDSQIVEIHAYRHDDKDRPRALVTIMADRA